MEDEERLEEPLPLVIPFILPVSADKAVKAHLHHQWFLLLLLLLQWNIVMVNAAVE